MRLDKILSNSGLGSRKEVKQIIKSGEVYVSKKRITDPGYLVDPDKENILVNGEPLYYKKFYYLMMNKPAGVITATRDLNAQTVIFFPTPMISLICFLWAVWIKIQKVY